MDKKKIFSVLGRLGAFCLIFLVVSYFMQNSKETQKTIILDQPQEQVGVPTQAQESSRIPSFDRMKTRKKLKKMKDATFLAPDGSYKRWRNFEGGYTLVNFWASWCPACVVELPSLTRLQKAYEGKGLAVIAISLDKNMTQEQLKSYLKRRGIGEFAAYMDARDHIQYRIKMRGLPTTYLLNPKGEVMHVFEGDANWFSPHAIDFFESLLSQDKG